MCSNNTREWYCALKRQQINETKEAYTGLNIFSLKGCLVVPTNTHTEDKNKIITNIVGGGYFISWCRVRDIPCTDSQLNIANKDGGNFSGRHSVFKLYTRPG